MHDDKRLKRKVRNSYIISTVSIALVLFLLGSVGYLIATAFKATDRVKESVAVYVMLNDGLDGDGQELLRRRFLSSEAVREAEFVAKEDAARDFADYLGTDFTQFLDYNPLPDSYEVRLKAEFSDAGRIQELENEWSSWPEVKEVVYQRNVMEQIGTNLNKFNLVLLAFGAGLLVISLILLNNTIRISIFSKRYIISTMKLVGATKWFIMRPFLGSAIMQGVWSAILACLMFAALVAGIQEGLPELRDLSGYLTVGYIMAGMLLLGITISLIFTALAVNKFVKIHTDAVHFY